MKGVKMNKDEKRLDARVNAEAAIAEYFKACNAADYDFETDIHDVIFDATGGAVVPFIEADCLDEAGLKIEKGEG